MKHEYPKELLETMREKGFIEWLRDDASDFGEYPTDVDAPSHDAPEKEILSYIAKVKLRSLEIRKELEASGADEFDVDYETPTWPLEKDAPIEAVRAYLKYLEENAEAASQGIIID